MQVELRPSKYIRYECNNQKVPSLDGIKCSARMNKQVHTRYGTALQVLPNGNYRMVSYGGYRELTLITPEWTSASREDSIKESDEWLRKYCQYVQDYIRAITIREEV